jgi:hypothetical protein
MSGDHNMYSSEKTYVFHEQFKKAGCWVIGDSLHVYVSKRPCWLHKKMSKFLLGWDWKDGDYKEHGIK